MSGWFLVIRAPKGVDPSQEFSLGRDDVSFTVFTSQARAQALAEKLAKENPGRLIGVLNGSSFLEAGQAPIVKKGFNDSGDFVVQG